MNFRFKINSILLQNNIYKENMSNFVYIMSKKGDFEIPKVINPDFSTKTLKY